MPAPTKRTERTDWYQEITSRIITALEAGPEEWAKPWRGIATNGFPRNGSSGRRYNGLNVWLLALAGYDDARWYTFNQAKDLGASVRKGEHGTKIFFWQFLKGWIDVVTGDRVKDPSPADIASGKVKHTTTPLLKVFTVFNAQQIEGLAAPVFPAVNAASGYERAAIMVELLGLQVDHVAGTETACYRPSNDRIHMPLPGQFNTVEDYWATLLHEVIHWTAHSARLDRDLGARFGSDSVAMEEMVAEIGSAFLCADLGIEGNLRHEGYIAHWLRVLRGDKYAVFKASSLAQKAVEFILAGGGLVEAAETAETAEDEAAEVVARAA